MSAIEDVHEELDADVSAEEFEEMVAEKVEEMGGLADDETAAMLVAHELEDEGGEVESVADVEPGMDDVKFVAKLVSIGEKRTFERDGDQPDGQVVNTEVADESGRIRLSLWDEMAESALEELEEGDVLRIAGRPKEGYNGVEVSADKAEIDPDVEIDVSPSDSYTVEELSMGLSDVTLVGKLLDVDDDYRTFDRDDGTEGRVGNVAIGDETGRIRVTLWDEATDLLEELDAGEVVEVVDGYVREREGDLELHVGSRGTIEEVDEDVEYVPETTDIDDVEMGDTVDIAGAVIETDDKRTFDRDDGSQGQVRNVRVRDDTGDIRVALWGEKADRNVDLADRVAFTDVEIQDGWQDELEASAGWQSTVSVLDGEADVEAPDAGGEKTPPAADQGGLSAFGEDGDGADELREESDDAGDGEEVEFTGTVVQSGSPVVVDNGEETRSVETGESVQLGEEVTVRGVEQDGRIDADELL
ncbi:MULTISPECIES: single-stranded DNA binding protein [Halolamina]|uniref:Replication factor A1 n=1 Tax=Halolamina pelagica TaxID=699431 RepID=A0A1I5RPS4_9EURY|nr:MULTISPECIES: single-stranded DNA binding protein [Halolamina]NHX35286.1 single-stranded DNA binding protein [Halolamina sp. R1-12]SFP60518.1 replication factor A1 [Halolamina pelagica]